MKEELNQYRIRIEKLPGEDFKRYYPEVNYSYDCKDVWTNSQSPIEIRWYKDIDECKKHIKMLSDYDKKSKGYFTEEYIYL